MSSGPRLRGSEPPPRPAVDLGPREGVSGEGVSGEIVVPATGARNLEAAPVGWPELPDPRYRLMFYLCVVTLAVITAAALAVA